MAEGAASQMASVPAESQPILEEIRQTFGFIPPALGAVARDPVILRSAWLSTRIGYVENPLPPLFKERFMAVMAKYNLTPYSLIVRSCSLRRMGMTGQQILEFLRSKLPAQRRIAEQLGEQSARWTERSGWSSMPGELENWVLWAAARMTVRKDPGGRCRNVLYEVLGGELFDRLVALSTFAAMQRVWVDAHPDFDAMQDQRVMAAHKALLKETPEFAQLWDAAQKRSARRVPGPRERRLVAEIAKQDRIRKALRASEQRFRKVVESMPFPVMVYAADGEVVLLNNAFTEHSGWQLSDVPTMEEWCRKGQHDDELWVAADVESLFDWPEPVEEGVQSVYTASGQMRTWDFSSSCIGKLPDGRHAIMRTAVDVTDRHLLEMALWDTNERITNVLEAITDAFVALDRDTRFSYCNGRVHDILLVRPEEMLGKKFLEVFPHARDGALYAAVLRCLCEGTTEHIDHYSERADTFYEVHLYPSEEGLSAFIRDIGRRKRMEQVLRANERRFRGLFECDMLGIMFADRFTGAIMECNDALLKIVGYSREDVKAGRLNWMALTPPEYLALDEAAAKTVAQSPLVPYEKEYIHRDGHRVPVLIGGSPVIPDEAVVMAFVIDRTAQKEAERRGEEIHRLLDSVLQVTPLPTTVLDLDGNLIIWNHAAERMFGWTAEEALGKRPPVVPPEDLERLEQMFAYVRAGNSLSAPDTPCLTKDGSIILAHIEARPVCDSAGKVLALMSIAHPVSPKGRES